jgi:thiol-disulfide isomerase/thioredoxin
LPSGTFTFFYYGDLEKGGSIRFTVPPNQANFTGPTLSLTASPLALWKGRPAPELAGVLAWKGKPTRFADLKGKYILVDFWGYWCGPCVEGLPSLMNIYDRFKDKGLAVVGVHVDTNGEVDTVDKLDAKLVGIKKTIWAGRDLPFPVALTEEKDGAAHQYGIVGYPTTILIDRQGNIVDELDVYDEKAATDKFKALLKLN